jgi:hypothetical protein
VESVCITKYVICLPMTISMRFPQVITVEWHMRTPVLVVVSDSLHLPSLVRALAPEGYITRVFTSPMKSGRIWSSEMPASLCGRRTSLCMLHLPGYS